MSNILALEVLHKLLRSRSVSGFSYELGEQLTSINTHDIQRLVEKDLGLSSTRVEPFVTEGFEDAWKRHNGKVRTPDGEALSIPNTHARIIAFSISQEDAVTQSEFGDVNRDIRNETKGVQSPPGDHIGGIAQLNREFIVCRKDRVGRTRRKAINSILMRLDNLQKEGFSGLELRTRLCRQCSLEARNLKEFLHAIEETQKSFEALFKCNLTAGEKYSAVELLVEWTIDFAQSVGPAIDLNKIVARLNEAIKYLGQQIGPNNNPLKPVETVRNLLCMRAKCRRALASLYQRRGQRGKTVEKEINKLRAKALEDAERGYQEFQSQDSKLELALCLFSNSATAVTEKAKRGMALLEEAVDASSHLMAGYELVKQLRLRHEFEGATKVFKSIAELDDDRRRFHANITHFAASVIGMHYSGADADTVKQNALLALQWLEEVISYDHHKAREVVDYCYLKAICGFAIEDSQKPLDELKPTSEMAWNDLAHMAQQVSQGDMTLGDALLLGLEDAAIWGRIGSLYSDFSKDFQKAIEFYERASLIDRGSPVFHFNKAER